MAAIDAAYRTLGGEILGVKVLTSLEEAAAELGDGGSEGAERGTLAIMVGGSDADVERARPFMEAYGTSITHVETTVSRIGTLPTARHSCISNGITATSSGVLNAL